MTGRIPDAEIERIKQSVDIVDVIGTRLALKTVGREKVGLCPFHAEHTPSFTVTPSKQLYLCFGCGATGDALRFLERYEGRTFLEALEELAKVAGLPVPKPERRSLALETLQEAMAYYRRQLLSDTPGAAACRQYLDSRGITLEIASEFGLGYAPPGGRALLEALKGAQPVLKQVGLVDTLKDNQTLRDRFRERLVIPVRSPGGQIIGVTARTLIDETPKYLNSQLTEWFRKDKTLFGLDHFRRVTGANTAARADKIYVFEGQTDVIITAASKESRVCGVLGRAVSLEQARTLLSLADIVVFTFDGDSAGRQSIETTLHMLLEASGEAGRVRFKRLPQGEDPGSLIRNHGLEAFYAAPEAGFLETLLTFLPEGSSADDLLAKAEAGLDLIDKIRDPLLQDAAIRAVAKEAQLSPEALVDRLAERRREASSAEKGRRSRPVEQRPAFSAPATALWRSLLENPQLLVELQWPKSFSQSQDETIQMLPEMAARWRAESKLPDVGDLASTLDELFAGDFVKAIYAMPAPPRPEAEAKDALAALDRQLVRSVIQGFIDRVKAGETLNPEEWANYSALIQQQRKEATLP